jgi:basic membrane lipoprotein Med (substrate-binding protein (PBP1-ABC) superfamily)
VQALRCLALLAATLATSALADPALIYELGGKADRSFNQAASEGAERWRKATGGRYLEFEVAQSAQREQAARRFAQRGAAPVVAIGHRVSPGRGHPGSGLGIPADAIRHHRRGGRFAECAKHRLPRA